MATLKNTTISSTNQISVPSNTNAAAGGAAGQLRYNPGTQQLEHYKLTDTTIWQELSTPFLTRTVVTTGYLHGGYAASTVFNTTNRTIFATDTTVNISGGTQTWAHNYSCSVFNRTRNFTLGASNAHCSASTNVACFNMRTEVSNSVAAFPVSNVNSGAVQQQEFFGWWQNSAYSTNLYELNLTTETGYTAVSGASVSGQLWGTSHENYGIFWGGGQSTFTFATRTNAARTGTTPSGDGNQKTIQFKQGFHYAGREGNPSTNWRKTNMFTNTSADAVGAKPYSSGEENMMTGQDWGYAVGWYQGSHVNTAFKFVYSTETGYGTTAALEAKGNAGNSSATMSWRD